MKTVPTIDYQDIGAISVSGLSSTEDISLATLGLDLIGAVHDS